MKRKSSVCPALLLLALLTSACFVKEDRSACPCHLVLDFSGVESGTVVDLYFATADGSFTGTSVDLGEEKVCAFEVPRTDFRINAVVGAEDCFDLRSGLVIPESRQCPAVYLSSFGLDTRRDRLEMSVVPRKNYCTVEVSFQDFVPFRQAISIVGETDGCGLDGKIRKGKFRCQLHPDTEGRSVVRIPRQSDASLVLSLSDEDGQVKSFALGEYILASGYDWSRPDLEDIIVEIDYACTEISFIVNGWEKTEHFDVNF